MSLFLILKSYFNKSKKQVFVICLLILLASILLGVGIILNFDYEKNFYTIHDRLNSEHIIADYTIYNDCYDEINDVLENDINVSSYEVSEIYSVYCECKYSDGQAAANCSFIPLSTALNKKIGRYELIDEENKGNEGIYVPLIFKYNGYDKVGEDITININGDDITFRILGYLNSAMTGSLNCANFSFALTPSSYERLKELNLNKCYRVSIRLNDDVDPDLYETIIIPKINGVSDYIVLNYSSNSSQLSITRYVSESFYKAFMNVSSMICIVVLFAVIAVSLSNYIRENMANLGALKSLGFVSYQLIYPIVIAFSIFSIIVSSIGVMLSYLLFIKVNDLMMSQVGMPYNIHILVIPSIICVILLTLIVCMSVRLSVGKIKKILPIEAIRPSKNKGNEKSKYSLKNSILPINSSLGVKSAISNKKNNLVFFISSFFVSILLSFSCFSIEYALARSDEFISMIFQSDYDSRIIVSANDIEETETYLSSNDDVDYFFYCNDVYLFHEGGSRLLAHIIDDKALEPYDFALVEGRFPTSDNEISINRTYAKKNGLDMNDELTLYVGNTKCLYSIVGFVQGAAFSGKDLFISKDGFNRISSLNTANYAILVKDNVDIKVFNEKVSKDISTIRTINYKETRIGISATYISVLRIIVIALVILSVILTILVLNVLINIHLYSKKKEHGVLKALGYVTSQIKVQTAISFIPSCLLGMGIGLLASRYHMKDLFVSFIYEFGVYRCGGLISMPYILITLVFLVSITFISSYVLSNRIKHISPHMLFTNE